MIFTAAAIVGLLTNPTCGGVNSDNRGFAYCITNDVNGKRYIGICQKVSRRWGDHKRSAQLPRPPCSLHRAMAKYGVESFSFEVIACAQTWEDLLGLERILISQHRTHVLYRQGYNMTHGGEGVLGLKHSAASRKQMSVSRKMRPRKAVYFTKEAIEKMKIANSRPRTEEEAARLRVAMTGKKHSPETRARMSAAHTGKPKSAEHKAKMLEWLPRATAANVAAHAGKPRPPEVGAKISASLKGRHPSKATMDAAHAAWGKGSKHTPEALAKISAASIRRWEATKAKAETV